MRIHLHAYIYTHTQTYTHTHTYMCVYVQRVFYILPSHSKCFLSHKVLFISSHPTHSFLITTSVLPLSTELAILQLPNVTVSHP